MWHPARECHMGYMSQYSLRNHPLIWPRYTRMVAHGGQVQAFAVLTHPSS